MTTTVRPTRSTARDGLLRLALRGDAVLTGAAGVVFLLAGGWLDSVTGLGYGWLALLGAVLVGYGVAVWAIAAPATVNPGQAWAVVGANLACTVVSVVVLVGDWLPLTTAGVVVAVAMALHTTVFADLQYLGLRRLTR